MNTTTFNTENFVKKLNQRRKDGIDSVVDYMRTRLTPWKFTPEDFEPFRPHMTVDELATFDKLFEDQARERAERKAQYAAQKKAEAEAEAAEEEAREAFLEKYPTDPLSTLINGRELEEGKLFDLLARYGIKIVTDTFDTAEYHWDELLNVQHSILFDDEDEDDGFELPDDGIGVAEGIGVGELLYDATEELADQYVRNESPGKITEGGIVTFDVAERTISLSVECEVTQEETYEETWSV